MNIVELKKNESIYFLFTKLEPYKNTLLAISFIEKELWPVETINKGGWENLEVEFKKNDIVFSIDDYYDTIKIKIDNNFSEEEKEIVKKLAEKTYSFLVNEQKGL